MTVTENLEMGAFQRTDKENFKEDMDRVFELFPRLYERRTQKAGTMSGGEQQMCAIGRALMARPKLLLLDEPSMGLAPIFVEKIFEIVIEINKQGTPVLLVEQNALMALDVANRGYVLETGPRRARGPCGRAEGQRAGAQDLPRRGLRRRSGTVRAASDDERRVRRRHQHAEAVSAARHPAGHLERRRDVVRRDEPERARGAGVAAAGDEHAPRAGEGRRARGPVGVRQQRVRRAALAIGADRTRSPAALALAAARPRP